jgi:hypothetical protein
MLPADRIEHRRPEDRELLGWVRPEGDGFVPVDRLGRDLTAPVDWLAAEDALDAHGLRRLADPWQLTDDDGTVHRVRFVEVGTDRVVVVRDHLGAVVPGARRWTLGFPAPVGLAPFAGDAHVIDGEV